MAGFEVVAGLAATGAKTDAAAAEGYNAAAESQIAIVKAIVCTKAAGEMGMWHSSGCWESTHTDRPWDRLSLAQELPGTQRDCIEMGREPASRSHSSADCTVVSVPEAGEMTEHNAGGCTFVVVGTGQHTTMRTRSPVAIQHYCFDIRPATAVLARRPAAGYK